MVYRIGLTRRLRSNPRITIIDKSSITAFQKDGALVLGADGESRSVTADLCLMAQGRSSQAMLGEQLVAAGIHCHLVGDSENMGRIGDAVHAAYQALRSLSAQRTAPLALAC
jgi:hypothetical protein